MTTNENTRLATERTPAKVREALEAIRDHSDCALATFEANQALATLDAPAPVAADEALVEALTPSGETKAAYHGEFAFTITETVFDEDEQEFSEQPRIKARLTLSRQASPAPDGEAVELLATCVAAAEVYQDGGDIAAIEAFDEWLPKARAFLSRTNRGQDHE